MNSLLHNDDARFLDLLRKWQSGDFTRADEQELKALAATDPFRLEAWEGMQEHPEFDHAAALASLGRRIQNKQHRRVALPQWLAIAAAIVLLLGAIWFFNIRPFPTETGQVAQEMPRQDAEKPEAEPLAAPTTSTATENESGAGAPARSAPAAPTTISPAVQKDLATAPARTREYKSQDTDDQLNGLAAADKTAEELYDSPGAVEEKSTNVAQPEELAKQSVPRAQKKMDAAKPAPGNAESKDAIKNKQAKSSGTAQPVSGWQEFRLYLGNNARLTPQALANNVTGVVRVRFIVDDRNQPTDFQVLKSLGYGCDEAAIQLIKSVTWMGGDGRPITVDVPFVR